MMIMTISEIFSPFVLFARIHCGQQSHFNFLPMSFGIIEHARIENREALF